MIFEGVTYKDNNFIFDFENDGIRDVVKINEIPIHKSTFMDNLYLYGYKFEDGIEGSIKSEFIKELKEKSSAKILNQDLYTFVSKSITNLHNNINLTTFEYIIYPETRGEIMNVILRKIYDYTAPKFNTIELVKKAASEIEFDFDAFYTFMEHKNYKKTDRKLIEDYIQKILDEVKTYNYFSIANAVKKPKYRPFFKNFLKFKNKKDELMFKKMQNTNVLIIDDINTSGSTLKECLRVIDSVNMNNKKVIYTFLGKNIETLV